MQDNTQPPTAERPTAETLILTVFNGHLPGCGQPPRIVAGRPGSTLAVSYFENAYGEQWLFVCDRQTRQATLYSGDCGWDRPTSIVDGHPAGDLVMADEEFQWVAAAYKAATGTTLEPPLYFGLRYHMEAMARALNLPPQAQDGRSGPEA